MYRPSKQRTGSAGRLGLVVVVCLGLAAWGLYVVGMRQGVYRSESELTIRVLDASDLEPGTIVRIRGVEAGKVIHIEPPEADSDRVRVRIKLDRSQRERLHANASARIATHGLLGTGTLSILPGTPNAGPLLVDELTADNPANLAEVTDQLAKVAGKVDRLLEEYTQAEGTISKLIKDDSLYRDLRTIAADTQKLVGNVDRSVTELKTDAKKTLTGVDGTVVAVRQELDGLQAFVRTGQEALTAIKQDAEAIKSMPLVRDYVEDTAKLLVRPTMKSDRVFYVEDDLFEPNRAVLSTPGRAKLDKVADWLNGSKPRGSEIVVASWSDPKRVDRTGASARELTRMRSEVVVNYLRDKGVHKMGGTFTASRKLTPLGMGTDAGPIVETEKLPTNRTDVILFVPQ